MLGHGEEPILRSLVAVGRPTLAVAGRSVMIGPARMASATDLNHIRAFTAVCETGSFTAAAERLGCPRSTVSRAVAALERTLGATLLRRSTRTVRLTAEGKALYERTASALRQLDGALALSPLDSARPAGTVRVSVPPDLASVVLAQPCSRLVERYPEVIVEVRANTRVVDLVGEGFDFGIRVSGGALRSSGLTAQKLGDVSFRLYASPAYLQRKPEIRSPDELSGHRWVEFRGPHRFERAERRAQQLEAKASIIVDDMWVARELARAHGGLIALPRFLGEPDVDAGRLSAVLPEWSGGGASIYLVRPGGRSLPARALLLRKAIFEHLREHPLR